jgi:hypothetical protein
MIPMGVGMATVNAAIMFFDRLSSMVEWERFLWRHKPGQRRMP